MFNVNFDLFRKKTRCDEKKEQQKEEGVPTKRRRISGPAISDDEIQVLDRKQIHKEFERLNPQDPSKNAFKDRKANIQRDKKLFAVGYKLYKEDSNRPPTPDGSGTIFFKVRRINFGNVLQEKDTK